MDSVQAGSAVASAFATIALAIFAAIQIRIYQRQTRVMDLAFRASRRAAHAAVRSAKAAEDSIAKSDELLAHAERSAVHELRAYIVPDNSKFEVGADHTGIAGFMMIKNVGKTPAIDVIVHTIIQIDEYPQTDVKHIVVNHPDDRPLTRFELRPGEERRVNAGALMKSKEFDSILIQISNAVDDEKKALYIRATIQYKDVFGASITSHFSRYTYGKAWPAFLEGPFLSASGNTTIYGEPPSARKA